jgi:hypothetical protein
VMKVNSKRLDTSKNQKNEKFYIENDFVHSFFLV